LGCRVVDARRSGISTRRPSTRIVRAARWCRSRRERCTSATRLVLYAKNTNVAAMKDGPCRGLANFWLVIQRSSSPFRRRAAFRQWGAPKSVASAHET
jgi:hypothetical protein